MENKITKIIFFQDVSRYSNFLEKLIHDKNSFLYESLFGKSGGIDIEEIVKALLVLEKARYLDSVDGYDFKQAEKRLKIELVEYVVANFLKNYF
ncbi:hypothetical protein [Oceanimonas marisflavi]|uniref:hypothetical protein n=1 Tax=Oceanimonas marisflavi TaxID=2059724 RepID=UPI000D317202|nr:hypothetical protein [Oceanimonas marisflavi]